MERFSQSPADPAFVQSPYAAYDRARGLGDIVFWEDYGLPAATSHAAVSAIMRDRRLGREAPPECAEPVAPHTEAFYAVEAHSMLELEPPRHTRLRGLVLRAFTSRRIAGLGPEIEALCHRLIDGFGGEVELLSAYARTVPVTVIARLLGVPDSMGAQLLAWSGAMVAMYRAGRTRAEEEEADRAAAEFAGFLRAHIEARRSRPADDLLTHLIAAEEDGARLSPDEMISTCILLLNAGHEATVHSLGNGVKTLLETGVAFDPAKAAETAEEILRFDPPLHLFTRWVYEPVTLFGHAFARGDRVACLLGAANRDPAVYDAPEQFRPERFATGAPAHMAFGAGPHFCVGAPLARLELQIALRVLFDRCPKLRLAAPPRYGDIYHFHGLARLDVTPA
ncbi:cytochrome P450 [Oceaniglobus roseus]|uniref:cytochrome P450 n=1 Tax=Oceaniglobus roseus TaxID=1737570 RepID=UPI000C7F27BD|nr:cytochrome P450 [Kandeliimicrobium roseum]